MKILNTTAPEDILDVLIVGAGLSGIGAARYLQQRCPEHRYAILESREALGGTWDLFRYPGVRSDSDMYTLGYAFKPWTGAKAIVDGPSILRYIHEAAEEGDVFRHIRFGHAVRSAAWSSEEACWTLEIKRGNTDADTCEYIELKARFLYLCCGYYSYASGHRPEFEGEARFQGQIVLPQFWPEALDYAGKRVVVIGSGATAVTLVPEMAKTAAHVTQLQRSPTYMVTRPSQDRIAHWLSQRLPVRWAYGVTRWKNVLLSRYFYQLARRRPAHMKKRFIEMVAQQLEPQFDVATHFTPRYNPWDQRVCAVPDGDFFEQIRKGHVSVVTDTIECFTSDGLRLASGQELPADIVVMATGLKLNALGDIAFSVNGQPLEVGKTMSYKGMMLSDVPNLVRTFGYVNASWTLKADLTAIYVCRLLRYMKRHGHSIAVPQHDPSIAPLPFLDFSAGYVLRSHSLLPQQGARAPWQVHQNFLTDLPMLRWGRIADGVMQFKSAAPVRS